MRRCAVLIAAAALACSACGLFMDDLSKGSGEDGGADTDTETGTETEITATPCEGVDLAATPCCNLEDTCLYSFFPECDCPTCPWDAFDCGTGDGGVPDGGSDTEMGA